MGTIFIIVLLIFILGGLEEINDKLKK